MTASPPGEASLVEADDARVAIDGVVAIDRLTLRAGGDRVLFAGDAAALFAALTHVPLGLRGAAAVSRSSMPSEAMTRRTPAAYIAASGRVTVPPPEASA